MIEKMKWSRTPRVFVFNEDRIEITTEPHTDLWQRTYYHFQNDNAPVLQMETEEKFFSFVVKTDFSESHHRFDQCGIVMYRVFAMCGRGQEKSALVFMPVARRIHLLRRCLLI